MSIYLKCLHCVECLHHIVCLYMYKYMDLLLSQPQIALPLLGDIGVLLKVLCCYVRNYMLISRKNQKGNLYKKLIA